MAEVTGSAATAGGPEPPGVVPPSARSARKERRRKQRLYNPISPKSYLLLAVLSFIGILFFWWAAAALDLAKDIFLPSPGDVLNRAAELWSDGTLFADAKISFLRITIGFLLSTAMALPLGILIGTFSRVEAAVEPPVDFIRYMPAVAFVPLTIVWVGVGEPQKWLIIYIGTFFQQVLMFQDNVKRVPREFVNIGYTLGFKDNRLLRKIILPASGPAIWDTLRITLGWAWTWLVVAELVAASDGLGHRIVTAQRYFQTDTIFLGILTIGVLGLMMDQVMKFAGKRLFRWAE